MELDIETYQKSAKKYLKYQFALYPIKSESKPELQIAIM